MTTAALNIRPAADKDRPAIWEMLRPVFRAGETYCIDRNIEEEDALRYWLGGTHTVFVAESEGRLLGTYFLCPNQAGGGAHVCNCGFVTADAARGRGIAREMLRHSLATAKASGYHAMQFNFVVSTNTRAIAIWNDHGFEVVGRLPQAFRHPTEGLVDALVMFRQL